MNGEERGSLMDTMNTVTARAIHEALEEGDLRTARALAAEAQDVVARQGDLRAAIATVEQAVRNAPQAA